MRQYILLLSIMVVSCSDQYGHGLHKVKVKDTNHGTCSIILVDTMFHVGDTILPQGDGYRIIIQE